MKIARTYSNSKIFCLNIVLKIGIGIMRLSQNRFCDSLIICLLLLLTTANNNLAYSRPIISGISTNEINIDTKFTGAEVLLFGAKGDAGDIVITIRGPKKDYFVSKKDRFLGVWYNKYRFKFKDNYSYYAFFSDHEYITNKILFSPLEISTKQLKFNIQGGIKQSQNEEFKIEFINKLEKEQLYLNNPNTIEFLDETLFKVILKFPKNIPQGNYIVEIYLIDKNNLVAFQSIPIKIHQVGLSAKINNFAYNNSIFYGIASILMAIFAGFMAHFIFTRLFNK